MNECIGTCFFPHLVNSYTSQFQAGVRLRGVAVRKKEKKGSVEKGKIIWAIFSFSLVITHQSSKFTASNPLPARVSAVHWPRRGQHVPE